MRHDSTSNNGLDTIVPHVASETPAIPAKAPQIETTALSSHYLWLIIGIPLAAFIIAVAPAMQERHPAFPFKGIIGGTAGLRIQALPCVLPGVVVSASGETSVGVG